MTLIDVIVEETEKLGYRTDAIRRDYCYSDVWSLTASTRSVPLAAFTQTPPSYRSAAFGVIETPEREASSSVHEHRALGAPLFFVIESRDVSVWQVHANKRPSLLGRISPGELPAYFQNCKDTWAPAAIHRAKSIGRISASYQLTFVDVGLIPAIEGEIHTRLDRLIREAVAGAPEFTNERLIRVLFRGVFRLLAAKILMDRQHPRVLAWDGEDVRSVLLEMDNYYELSNESQAWPRTALAALERVWKTFKSGFNVANISADDLAYVYESTLVTDTTRADFGTHSTPRHVTDYIVDRLRLWEFGSSPPRVYEPFAGAGVFLGSALRHMREGLPHAWSDKQRHDLLIKHIGGAEIDSFAAEVAKLSLILADYPNENGWLIEEVNLFEKDVLAARIASADVILCNPPFGRFKPEEQVDYPEAFSISLSKAVFALETSLRASPAMLGFVVPNTLLVDRRYREQRRQVERSYSDIEMVALPDGVFNVSQANTALLIARGRLESGQSQRIRSGDVADRDKRRFATMGQLSHVRKTVREKPTEGVGAIWLFPLQTLWDALADLPRLGDFLHGHWGLRWKGGQEGRAHPVPGSGRVPGFADTSDIHQFVLSSPQWLDVDPDDLLAGGNSDWNGPKILCNATRLSRGYWRLAAAVDRSGCWATQQFIGFWCRPPYANTDLDALATVINGPVVNAYLTERSFDKRFRIKTLEDAPIPANLPAELGTLGREYRAVAVNEPTDEATLMHLLQRIDAAVLRAYGLSAEQHQDLLSAFGDDERPVISRATKRRNTRDELRRGGTSKGDNGLPFNIVEGTFDHGDGLGEEMSAEEGERRLISYAKTVPVHQWAGELVSEQDIRDRFQLSKAEVDKWKAGVGVVVLFDSDGGVAFPVDQFVNGRPVKGLGGVLKEIGNPRVAWMWLRQPHAVFDARQPLEVLKSGGAREVIRAAVRDFR